ARLQKLTCRPPVPPHGTLRAASVLMALGEGLRDFFTGRTGGTGGSCCSSRGATRGVCAVDLRFPSDRNPKFFSSRTSRPPCEKISSPENVWVPSRGPLAEAHVPSPGPTARHASGCFRPDGSWRGPPRFFHREDGRYGRFLLFEPWGDARSLRSRPTISFGSKPKIFLLADLPSSL